MWPFEYGLIHTFFHAGGITNCLIRSSVGSSVSREPSGP
jgi:hypothetical protein